MNDEGRCELEILAPGRADVFLAAEESEVPWPIVERLDRAGVRVVGAVRDRDADREQLRTLMSGCSGAIIVAASPLAEAIALDLGVPRLSILPHAGVDLDPFLESVLRGGRLRPYAFLIGRLERDFGQARHAIRSAVERAAGIPCVWIDDGCHRSNIESVRERTRVLIKHATFVIADLSLGAESPERENPSRAHEIGMAIGYERPLILCSQEPRRYPYYSIGDMQMAFWSSEDELGALLMKRIGATKGLVPRRVFNYELSQPAISLPEFKFDPTQRFVGPNLRLRSNVRRLLAMVGLK